MPCSSCRMLVAAAGYGKTTALRRWFPPEAARWHRGVGSGLAELVTAAAAAGDRTVVCDDLPRLPAEEVRGLVAAVDALPYPVTVVLAARIPPAARAGPGRWPELGPAELALTGEQVAELLTEEYGLSGSDLAGRVHQATGGWPVLVHLVGEGLRRDGVPDGPLATAVGRPGTPLAEYLADEVLGSLPPAAVRLLRLVGDLAPVSAGLGRVLGHRSAGPAIAVLRRTGLLVPAGPGAELPGAPAPATRVVPVLAALLRPREPRPGRPGHLAAVAAWYERHGPPVAAARAYREAGDPTGCARVLAGHGDRMLAGGQVGTVAELVAGLPEPLRTRRLRLLLGDARRTLGDLAAAERAYQEVATAEPAWDAGLAWRMGRVPYQRGDARGALAAFARGRERPASPADTALLLAWTAHAHLLAGDTTAATEHAEQAVAAATGGDGASDGALATALGTAHLAMALSRAVAGDPAGSEEHYALATPIAQRTGDVLLLTRIATNRTFQLLRTARYPEALAMADQSARYATLAGSPSLLAIATCNQADALAMLGDYDQAARRYQAALTHYQQRGSRRFAGAVLGLAELYRRRGWREQARAGFEEAVRVAEQTGNAHVLVPALAGLAQVLLDDDPKAAADHTERAVQAAPAELAGPAQLAQGWVARQQGNLAGAAALAGEAARQARGQGDRAGLAEALELRAATEPDPARGREALREAYAIWDAAGAVVGAARVRVLLARLPGADPEDRLGGLAAAEQLAAAGARVDRFAAATAPDPLEAPAPLPVTIQALGRFEVRVGGQPVAPSGWQSRKARELLRILVARRGRPVPRSELCELLWPDDDPGRTGHRLSVLLSIVRGVLDPARALPAEHLGDACEPTRQYFLAADQASIGLDLTRVRVDVEDFLTQVAHGRRLAERGELAEARALLAAADRQHRADAFEDEPYADWAVPLREEVRAAYLSLLRTLARASRATGAPGEAVGYLLRLLERDAYDEPAHRALVRTLVAAGQHGEARRAFTRYRVAMREIGIRPPDESLLLPRPARPPAR